MKKRFIIFLLQLICAISVNAKIKINNVEVTNSNEHYLDYVRHMKVPDGSNFGPVWDAGNNIQGKTPAEVQAIVDAIKLLETSPVRSEIYDRMKGAPNEWYVFTSSNHARNVVKQRIRTIVCMDRFNANKEYWYASPAENIPYSVSSPYWELGKDYPFLFKQKQGTAAEAIVSMASGSGGTTTRGECLGAIYACIWMGAYDGMGQVAFNQLYPGPKALDMDHFKSNSFFKNLGVAVDQAVNHQVPGDKLYLKNYNYAEILKVKKFWDEDHKWLDKTKNNYLWQGENAIYVGGGKYSGLGLSNLTYPQMREQMRLKYNKDFEKVIANGGMVNGTPIITLTVNKSKQVIQWTRINRIKH